MKGLWSEHFAAEKPRPPPPPTGGPEEETLTPYKMKGLWTEHFAAAEESPPPTPSTPPPPLGRYQRCLICPRCNAACRHLPSNTTKNPGRLFYSCSASNHKFFKWADEVTPNEFMDVPYCGGCNAGVCRVRRENSGPNEGRILFMCTIKEGQGSCGYRVWKDDLEKSAIRQADEMVTSSQSTYANSDNASSSNTDFVEENRQSDEGANNVSPVINTSQYLPEDEMLSPCKMKGLRTENFAAAEKLPPPTPSTPLPPLGRYQRCLICPRCNATCHLLPSNTTKNPGRLFYSCSAPNHNFFKWADEVTPNEFMDVPYCGGCNAGVCRVRRENSGPNEGRILFMCTIKEGEGSCGYRVWKDDLEKSAIRQADEMVTSSQSTNANSDNASSSNTNFVEENRQSDEGANNVSPVFDTSQHLQFLGVTLGTVDQSKCQEDKSKESSRRPPKRSRHGDLKAPGSLVSAESLTLCLAKNFILIKNSWMAAAIRQDLSSELQGWWGRLVFHPMPFLMPHASNQFTCYVSLPLETTFVLQDKIVVNYGDSTTTQSMSLLGVESSSNQMSSPGHNGIKSFRVALDAPSCDAPSCEIRTRNIMSKSILKTFGQASESLQNELIALLDKTDVKDHEAMTWAAEATYAALDRLLVDHEDFKERTKEFINCATSLAEIEQSMPTNDSYQGLVDQCSSQRMKLDEITCRHAKAVDTLTNNKQPLKVIQEEISSVKEWLFQIESELLCCEAKLQNMERELEQMSKDKEILEGSYVISCKELEECQKIREQKEEARNAAKAAFDRARMLLRG